MLSRPTEMRTSPSGRPPAAPRWSKEIERAELKTCVKSVSTRLDGVSTLAWWETVVLCLFPPPSIMPFCGRFRGLVQTPLEAVLARDHRVRHGRRVLDEGLRAAEAHGKLDEAQALAHFRGAAERDFRLASDLLQV